MRRSTILHTSETGGPGGAETVMLNLASGLDPEKFRSIALVPCEGWLQRSLADRQIPVFTAQSKGWTDLTLPRVMAQLVEEQQVDLIHSHLPDQNFYSSLVGRRKRRPVVATYHGALDVTSSKQRLKFWVVSRLCSAGVAVSDYLGRAMVEGGFPGEKLHRIYNGIDPQRFQAAPTGRLRAELGCSNGMKLVGMVANLRGPKGHDYFVRAAAHVLKVRPETWFVAVGDIDPVIERHVMRQAQELGVADRVRFLGFRRDVPQILVELDVFVLSSITEGFSIATIEAMAAARPVVVTRSGGPQEIVEDGRTGWLVPPADDCALAEKICDVLADGVRAGEMGEHARLAVQERFSVRNMVAEYSRL